MAPSDQLIAKRLSQAGRVVLLVALITSANWLQIAIFKEYSKGQIPTLILIESSILSLAALPITSLCAMVSKSVLKPLYSEYFSENDTHGQIASAAIISNYWNLAIHIIAMIIAPHNTMTDFLTSQTILSSTTIITAFSGFSLLTYAYLLSVARPIKLSP